MQKWQYGELIGKTFKVLGKTILRKQYRITEHGAWDDLGDDGWELVSVVADEKNEFHYFFKRPVPDNE